MSKLFEEMVKMQEDTMKSVQEVDDHYDIMEPLVSNCCGAKMYGVDKDGVGVCTECREMAEETDEYEVSNG